METPFARKPQSLSRVTVTDSRLRVRNNLGVVFIICFTSIMFSGISTMLMSVYLPVIVKDLLGNITDDRTNTVGAYLNSIFIFGSMFGGFTWGIICDRIGRSKSIVLSTLLYGLFTLLTAFSSSWITIGIYRFATGFGVGGLLLTTNILVAEIWPEKTKAVALGIVSSAVPVGFILAGAMNNLFPNWHSAFLTGVVPLATAIIAAFVLPESENWTLHHIESGDRAKQDSLFAADHRKNLAKGSIVFGAMLIGLWAVFSWAPTWIQSIAGNDPSAGDLRGLIMMVLAISGLVGSMISGWIVNAMGLHKTMIMCFAACFLVTFVVFKMNTRFSGLLFPEMGALAFFFGISQGALSVYIPALFPVAVRASATGFCFNISRLFTATVVFFIGALVTLLGGYGNAVFIFSFIFLIGLVFTWFSEEQGNNE